MADGIGTRCVGPRTLMASADSPLDGGGSFVLRGPRSLSLNTRTRRVHRNDLELPVTRREFDLLRVLLEHQGEVVTADDLSREVWGHGTFGSRNYLDARMSRLRSKLRVAGASGTIETVRGVGYVIPVEETSLPLAMGEMLAATYQSLRRAVLVVSPERRVLMANPAACNLTGYDEPHLKSMDTVDLLWREGDRESSTTDHEAALAGEEPPAAPRQLLRRDGSAVEVLERAAPLVFGVHVVGVLVELSPT